MSLKRTLSATDDERPPLKRHRRLDDIVSGSLQCTNCSAAMIPPIFLCVSGHSSCSSCQKDNCSKCSTAINIESRNWALEEIAMKMSYPCRNEGCDEQIPLCNKREHEVNDCLFRNLDCPQGECGWNGALNIFLNHLCSAGDEHHPVSEQKHFTGFPFTKRFVFPVPESTGDRFCMIRLDRDLFKLTLNTKKKLGMFLCLKYYGPPSIADQFCFIARLEGSESGKWGKKANLQYEFPVHNDVEDQTETCGLLQNKQWMTDKGIIHDRQLSENNLVPLSWFNTKKLFTEEKVICVYVTIQKITA